MSAQQAGRFPLEGIYASSSKNLDSRQGIYYAVWRFRGKCWYTKGMHHPLLKDYWNWNCECWDLKMDKCNFGTDSRIIPVNTNWKVTYCQCWLPICSIELLKSSSSTPTSVKDDWTQILRWLYVDKFVDKKQQFEEEYDGFLRSMATCL